MGLLRLVVVAGPDVGAVTEVPATGGTIGRGTENLIRLSDPRVSRVHARIVVCADGLAVEHSGGRNRTAVNGEPVDVRTIRAGDVIEMGDSRIAVVPDGQVAVLEAPPTRVTIERPTGRHDARVAPAVLAQLGDLVFSATTSAAMARGAVEHLARLWGTEHAAVVSVLDGRPTELGAASDPGRVRAIPRTMLERVIDGGAAIGFEYGGRHHLCAPFAPRGAAAQAAGLIHAVRAADQPWDEHELTVAVAAARLLGAGLAARTSWDVVARRTTALEERVGAPHIVGDSPVAVGMRAFTAKAGPTDATVLLTGESGTGKELLASALHQASRRADAPFVALNCAALSDALIESELFGHERGAFTGATERRPGRFELAEGGTLFLDEVGELPHRSQAKLLRVLEERQVERVGSARPVAVDVRIIAATNRDLEAMVRAGEFREDLFYRLAVVRFRLAPLRERLADVPLLAASFLSRLRVGSRRVTGFTPDALTAMTRHGWPGNVRELRNAIERALVLGDGDGLSSTDLLPSPVAGAAPRAVRSLRDAERDAVVDAMAAAGGNKAQAAALLGIDRTTLYKKLRDYLPEPGQPR